MKKVCSKCSQSKDIEEFQKRALNRDGHTSVCKECKRAYDNNYHKNRSQRQIEKKRSAQKERSKNIQNWIILFLQDKYCLVCGEEDNIVLEFHHTQNKNFNISDGVRRNYSIKRLQNEVAKCEILCANCHRRVTAKQWNYYRYIGL